LRVFKAEFRRPITRAAELMTAFGLAAAGLYPLIHLGRPWLAYWIIPYPNQRWLWPNFRSPLTWDMIAIATYLLSSLMYIYLPLIPDLAMARDHSQGWRYKLYRAMAMGWRGTEAEWHRLRSAIQIFAFAIIPVMFSVHTIVSWDFAMATRPGWHSTVFGPYFVIGALHSGMAAVAIVLFILRYTMKHYEYFIRAEHFNTIGMLMLIVSMAWAYFYFNDYLAPWYGVDKWEKLLQEYTENGPVWYLWYIMLICNIAVPWLILWNRKWRQTPWLLASAGLLINVGMWLERYVIIPVGVTVNRMPFTWRQYYPRIEIPMTIGTFAFFLLLYMLASRLIPLVPVWEVQEGQENHTLRQVGKATVPSISELE
jgi:Ni/Fe-hydrogenase subunit HybB-like protein